ncbi:hypothetical protein [Streptomyces atroolivaceus]|uniref:hypothetical protein n=1 Tax=Streptomyces atroolivaceus TaxID=66869 RepID=UPI00363482AA
MTVPNRQAFHGPDLPPDVSQQGHDPAREQYGTYERVRGQVVGAGVRGVRDTRGDVTVEAVRDRHPLAPPADAIRYVKEL